MLLVSKAYFYLTFTKHYRMTIIIIIIILPSKQSPERFSDLHKNRSHSVVEPEFNYSHHVSKLCLLFGPKILNAIDLETHKRDITLKILPRLFFKGIYHSYYL